MNKFYALLFFTGLSVLTFAQNSASGKNSDQANSIYTSIRPTDGQPAVFSSQEELSAKLQSKKDNIIAAIETNKSDSAAVRRLREDLWRMENAVVKSSDNNK